MESLSWIKRLKKRLINNKSELISQFTSPLNSTKYRVHKDVGEQREPFSLTHSQSGSNCLQLEEDSASLLRTQGLQLFSAHVQQGIAAEPGQAAHRAARPEDNG